MRPTTNLPRSIAIALLIGLFAVGIAASTRLTHVARGSSTSSGLGVIRLGGGNWGTLSNTDKYSMIVAGSGNANAAGALPGRSVMYSCGTNTFVDNSASAACGVSYSTAVANNWILRDSSGNPIYYKGNSSIVLLDIGNPAYQQAFVSAIDADLRTHPGIDGVFIDDVTGSLFTNTAASTKYPDSASYRAAMLSFMQAVGPALQAKGWYVDVNASIYDPGAESTTGTSWDGSQYIWWVNQIAPDVNGINMEHWQQNWDSTDSIRVSGSSGNQAWDGWQRVPGAVQSLGKDFYALDWGAPTDTAKAMYLRASFLLDWRPGHGAFLYSDNYSGNDDPWKVTALPDAGRPLGPASRVGIGFARVFTLGIVLVNPSGSQAQTFKLGRAYLTGAGSPIRFLTLPPGTAQILQRQP